MKKLLVVLVVFVFFVTGCKNNKTGNTPNLNNREKDDYSKNDDLKNDNENKTTANTGNSGWTENDKTTFLKACVGSFDENNTALANQICPCVLGKLEKEYPSYSDANTKGGEEAGKRLAIQCKDEISGTDDHNNNSGVSSWPQSERDAFKTNCEKNAIAGGSSSTVAQSYCACMLIKMENLYPNVEDAGKLTEKDLETPEMKKMINDCLGKQ